MKPATSNLQPATSNQQPATMMLINENTRISSLLKENPEALEAIVSLSPKFEKLRNPLLRKLITGRTTIAMASKIGGCSVDVFFKKLLPLGFIIDKEKIITEARKTAMPDFVKKISKEKIITLDVRPVIESGKDPLDIILKNVKSLEDGQVLNVINSFEPTPLIRMLDKQGFESYAEIHDNDVVYTYFNKKKGKQSDIAVKKNTDQNWDEIIRRFDGKLVSVDVRQMEMPLPMHTILDALDNLHAHKALFVYHKRIPVFLLPELEERKFNYRIREVNNGEVHLLIYKD